MRKKIVFCVLVSFMALTSYSQKEDYNWLLGDFNVQDSLYKNKFMFNDFGLSTIDTIKSDANFYITNSSISDSLGNLLFYTNGRKIYNAQHQVIENGDSLNFTPWGWNLGQSFNHYSANQGVLILQKPNTNNEWFMFHLRKDTLPFIEFPNDWSIIKGLMFSKIVISDSNDLKVVSKNIELIGDTMFSGNLTACKHGNGRDWWIFASEGKSNCIYQLLLSPSGIQIFDTICEGLIGSLYGDVGEGVFSPNGELYIKGSALNGIDIFDFDRCSGNLLHIESISRINLFDTLVDPYFYFRGAVCISPNSRYLYTTTADSSFRFDLNATNVASTKQFFKNIPFDSLSIYTLSSMQLGPDGRIYFPNSITRKYHVMNNPDAEDIALIDLQVNLPLLKNGSRDFPNFPNYRLGPLTGSACDTLGVGIQEIKESFGFLVKPNPASTYVEIDYGNFPWQSSSQASLHIYNLLGELVYTQNLPQYSGKRILDIQNFASGVYVLQINDNGNVVGTEKLVVYR
jgi:hypothetical protein